MISGRRSDAIDGFSKILIEDHSEKLDAESVRLLSVVRKNSQSMTRLIEDLLKFSRLNTIELVMTELNMEEIAAILINEIKTDNPKRNMEFVLKGLKPARGDAPVIRQALLNLLLNAVKFTSKTEKAIIEIGCKPDITQNVYYIRDNGIGFDMRYAEKLFGVFQRLHSKRITKGAV